MKLSHLSSNKIFHNIKNCQLFIYLFYSQYQKKSEYQEVKPTLVCKTSDNQLFQEITCLCPVKEDSFLKFQHFSQLSCSSSFSLYKKKQVIHVKILRIFNRNVKIVKFFSCFLKPCQQKRAKKKWSVRRGTFNLKKSLPNEPN